MNRLFLLSALLASTLAAQPHVGFLYPAGGRQGTSIEVRVGGQFLSNTTKVYVSGKGVEANIIECVKIASGKETQFMREELQKLNAKRAASLKPAKPGEEKVTFAEADQKRMDEIRDKLDEWQRRQYVPSIAENVRLQIVIAPGAETGPHQLRLETSGGISNSIIFCVSELPEYARKFTRVAQVYNVVNGGVPIIRTVARQPDPATDITLPVVVNGQMMPGASDQYRFRARKGQHLVIAATARELMPYVSDAVPGWFQAAIALRDAQGRQLASADHFLFHPDPLLHYQVLADGVYVAEIHDSIFRGREDFVYRLTIGEVPVITSIFPLGGKAGGRTSIQALGWNLPSVKLKQDLKGKPNGVHPVSLRKDGVTSNRVDFAVDPLPETSTKSASGRREKAQRVKLPVIVNGRIAKPGDAAFFRFSGMAGQQFVAEVEARRLGSPLDSVLRLTDASGKELALNDDFEDRGAGLITHQADSFLSFKLPANGTYYLQLADAQHKGGPEYGYRLRISRPQHDFALRVVPSSFNVRSGTTVPFTVYALRHDGFSGEIALKLKGAPTNFVLSGAKVPAGQDRVRITLTVPKTPGSQPLSIQLIGQAIVDGREMVRTAVPAEDMEQAFAYHHIVAKDAWLLRVIGSGSTTPWKPIEKPLTLQADTTTHFELRTPYRMQAGTQLALNDPPEGITIQNVTLDNSGFSVLIRVQGDKAKSGLRGNLILDAYRDIPANPAAGIRQARRQPMGTLPAVPFEVVGPSAPEQ